MISQVPEPRGDILAQLLAVMNPSHPKRAAFLVPEDAVEIPHGLQAYVVARSEGVLVTSEPELAAAFEEAPRDTDGFDRAMADILGYPEAKPDVVAACQGRPAARARAVQARDADGWVITETFASPQWLELAQRTMQRHVPPGGELVIMTPIEAIGRRILLREAGN